MTVQKSKKGVVCPGVGNTSMISGPYIIEIRETDELIKEVEKTCGVNPDPHQIVRARLVLREHERALTDAIRKLADVSDVDDSPNHRLKQHPYSNEDQDRNIQGVL